MAFNDATPTVSFSFDRRVRIIGVTHGSAVTALVYHDAGPLLRQQNILGSLAPLRVTNGYDALLRRVTNAVLRSSTFLVGTTNAFDTASRLLSVSDGTHTAQSARVARLTRNKERSTLRAVFGELLMSGGGSLVRLIGSHCECRSGRFVTIGVRL